jgi:Reverse transcriptase (RNA-dependent DNA polymerase)/GAG-pre-integrase domain/gag-polypeptide of LTR copia-type
MQYNLRSRQPPVVPPATRQMASNAAATGVGGTSAAATYVPRPLDPKIAPICKLLSNNFPQWSTIVEVHLRIYGKEAVLNREANPSAPQHEHDIAFGMIIGTLESTDMLHVKAGMKFWDVMDALRTTRHGLATQHRVFLCTQLHARKLGPAEDITDFCNDLLKTSNQLRDAGIEIHPVYLATKALAIAQEDPRFTAQCGSIVGMGGDVITMQYVTSALRAVQHIGHVPSATGLHAQTNPPAAPSAIPCPTTAAALNAVTKQIADMRSQMGRKQKSLQQGGRQGQNGKRQQTGQQQQSQQQHGKQQQQQHPQSSRQGRNVTCYNCGGYGHGFQVCKKPCTSCGQYACSKHTCPNRDGNNARGYVGRASQPPQGFQATGHGFVARATTWADTSAEEDHFEPLQERWESQEEWEGPPGLEPAGEMGGDYPFHHDPMEEMGADCPSSLENAFGFMARHQSSKLDWIVDSGATEHITNDLSVLHDFIVDHNGQVNGLSPQPLPRKGYGTVRFETNVNGKIHRRELHNVWYVPESTASLLSTQKLKRCGAFPVGKPNCMDEWWFDRDGTCFLASTHHTGLGLNIPDWKLHYPLPATMPTPEEEELAHALYSAVNLDSPAGYCFFTDPNVATDPETPELWHQRLGHTSFQSLYTMASKKLAKGINLHPASFKKTHNLPCEVCVMAKHKRQGFSPREELAEDLLHTLHSDVEVMTDPSIEGCRFAVTLLDEYTDRCSAKVLRQKSQVEDYLKEEINVWENETGRRCKILYTDRGGEYLSNNFKKWCAGKGIRHEKSVPRTPQQNGRAERLNQTLMDRARSMLLHFNLPNMLWSHALLYAVSIHNVLPSKRLGISPHQAFTGKVPNITGFRVFGCKVFARLPETQRNKLDPKSCLGIYMGPVEDGPGHKVLVYQPQAKRELKYAVHLFRDVVTFEDLQDVCRGTNTALHWGGNIPLPSRAPPSDTPVLPLPPHPEPMTGTLPPAQTPQLTMPQLLSLLQGQLRSTQSSGGPPLAAHSSGGPPLDAQQTHMNTHVKKPSVTRIGPVGVAHTDHAAVFNACGNLDLANGATSSGGGATLGGAASHLHGDKRQKLSAATQGPAPYVHVSLALPPPGPQVPLTAIDKYDLPVTIQQALTGPYARFWLEALIKELTSLNLHRAWTLVIRQAYMKVLQGKWLFVIKSNEDGVGCRFKCRWVAGGHRQVEGIDFNETFAPVARLSTFRVVVAVAAYRGWSVHQLDISTAFLHGDIDMEVYVEQPHGFVEGTNLVCRLNRSLYGLRQAPRTWNIKLNSILLRVGFAPTESDLSLFVKKLRGTPVAYITTVVDDMTVCAATTAECKNIVQQILHIVKGTTDGVLHHYNGMKLSWLPREHAVVISQPAHIKNMLHRFQPLHHDWTPRLLPMPAGVRLTPEGIDNADPSPVLNVIKYPYRALIGGLNYVACISRPDIAYTVNQLARYSNAPTVAHWEIAIGCLRYLAGTVTLGIKLGHGDTPAQAWVDSSHGTGTPDHKPVSGYAVMVYGGCVSHHSHTIKLRCTSSTESELRGMSDCTKEVQYIKKVLRDLCVPTVQFPILGDNKGAIDACHADGDTSNTRHLDIHLGSMRDLRVQGHVDYIPIRGVDNPADIFTKALPKPAFLLCRDRLGLVPHPH